MSSRSNSDNQLDSISIRLLYDVFIKLKSKLENDVHIEWNEISKRIESFSPDNIPIPRICAIRKEVEALYTMDDKQDPSARYKKIMDIIFLILDYKVDDKVSDELNKALADMKI